MEQIPALIVDDDEDMQRLVRMVIEVANEGLSVAGEASNGRDAIELIDSVEPSVIILDQMMPGMSGIETAREIRTRHPDLPIVLFTAFLDERLAKEASDAGIDLSVPKEEVDRLPNVMRSVRRRTG